MNYWLTIHWPPLKVRTDLGSPGVWLPDGRQQAGKDMKPGDKVLIYESLRRKPELRRYINGHTYPVSSKKGRQGIVAIVEVISDIEEVSGSKPAEYADGTSIWWRWNAKTRTLSEDGFVSMKDVNKILGYSLNYNFRGFGAYKSGLKKLKEQEYLSLVELFKKNHRSIPAIKNALKDARVGTAKPGEAIESEDHRLLKEYIAASPSKVLGENGLKTLHVEFLFPTADKADIVLEDQEGRIIGLEVEVSAEPKRIEGILQAIKYRFMLALVKEKKYNETRAFLVAYSLSDEIKEICKTYEVEYFTVDREDVKK